MDLGIFFWIWKFGGEWVEEFLLGIELRMGFYERVERF
jgi:hypothetical protein